MLVTAQHGRGFDIYNFGFEGIGNGAGGGWNSSHLNNSKQTGESLLTGAQGGIPCSRLAKWQVNGGFGGGGSACHSGGGGKHQ